MLITDPEEVIKIKARIADAENALHRVMMGEVVAGFRDQNGEQVNYSKGASKIQLEAYIATLKKSIGMAGEDVSPLRPYFS